MLFRSIRGTRGATLAVLCSVPLVVGFVLPVLLLVRLVIAEPAIPAVERFVDGAWNRVRVAAVAAAVAVAFENRLEMRVSESHVTFCPLDETRIADYVASGEPYDKAGGYGIQGRAGAFGERLEGSYSGVMGLPLFETAGLLREFGVTVP